METLIRFDVYAEEGFFGCYNREVEDKDGQYCYADQVLRIIERLENKIAELEAKLGENNVPGKS